MKIICYHNGADHQIERLAKFAAGLKYHGLDCSMVRTWAIEDCDLAVIWGHRQQNIINGQRSKGRHYLVMERGYIGDRFQWTSMGFDGLNGRAKFPEIDDGLARWNKHFDDFVKPWRETKGKTAVIMGQVHGDESIRGIDFDGWIQNIAGSLRAAGSDVWFRPHPARPGDRPPGLNVMAGALQEALDAAALVVTYNSNSGVDAVLAGVLTYAADPGSMVWEMSQGSLALASMHVGRSDWTRKMAYTQWLPEEIESGAAWDALRTVING